MRCKMMLTIVFLSGICLGVPFLVLAEERNVEMYSNEVFKAQFVSVDDANNIVETTLLGESWPAGTTIDDVNDIVTFTPQTVGVHHLEVSLEPILGGWEPKKRVYSWAITVNPTKSWTTTVVESVE
ncbi:hypothetical protein KAR91_60925 [Candidatus Pacearchaeota archaeon]|nr:hypothetical protein [Candidatus Pacearchaeota archaeon]